MIFESRPNVTADAGALTLKSGNAVILRGGSDSVNSTRAIHACLVEGLDAAGLPADAIQIVPTTDRAAVGEMLRGPRRHHRRHRAARRQDAGRARAGRGARAGLRPPRGHLPHLYRRVGRARRWPIDVTLNAKMRRTGVCGATETLLVHRDVVATHLKPVIDALVAKGCEIRGDATVMSLIPEAIAATEEDWHTEYEDAIISVKIVADVGEAIAHIGKYSSHHTEAIITEDAASVARFFNEIDSAILLHNASTQFADGGEFGFGGEIGIATGKFHARGPVGVEQLCSLQIPRPRRRADAALMVQSPAPLILPRKTGEGHRRRRWRGQVTPR